MELRIYELVENGVVHNELADNSIIMMKSINVDDRLVNPENSIYQSKSRATEMVHRGIDLAV